MSNFRYSIKCVRGAWQTTMKGETGEVESELASNPTALAAALLNSASKEDDKTIQNAEKITFSFSLIKRKSPSKKKKS